MSEAFPLLPENDYCEIRPLYDRDGMLMCVLRLKKMHGLTDNDWQCVLQQLRRFLKWVQRNTVCYDFVLDLCAVDYMTMDRMQSLQDVLSKKSATIDSFLGSTVILTSSELVRVCVHTVSELYPSRKPMAIVFVPYDDLHADNADPRFSLPKKTTRHVLGCMRMHRTTSLERNDRACCDTEQLAAVLPS